MLPRVLLLFVWHIRQQSIAGTIWRPTGLVSPSTLTDYELICFLLALAILQDLKEQGDAVEDLSSDEERDTTDAETDAETLAEESWCPPIPDTPDDPTESEIAGAADKLETMLHGSQPQANIFFQPDNLGALPALWLQAKLTISLTSIQDKFAKLFMTIAAELWLRGRIETLEAVFQAAARNFTIRLFFPLWYGRSRSEARSLHEQKQLSRKQLHGHRWSHAAWQIIKTKTQTTRNNRQDAYPPARFASHHPKDSKAVICQQIFSILALVIFLLKILVKSASKSSFFRSGVEIRFWSYNFRRRCA